MAHHPTGTSMDEDRLLALERREEGYAVEVTPLLERMDREDAPEAGTIVDWGADEREGAPMLVFGPVDAGAESPAEESEAAADAARSRRCYGVDDAVYVPVPERLLSAAPPGGLGLDLESYDPERPLLFEAIATDVTVGLVPARFADGRPYEREPRADVSTDSDPVAEAAIERDAGEGDATPRPETVSAPIDPDLLRETVAGTDVEPDDLVAVLEAVERHDLVGEGDAATGYPPLSVDERAVHVLEPDAWAERLAGRIEGVLPRDLALAGEDRPVLEAAATIHDRQGRRLIERAGSDATDYRGVGETYALVVTDQRETAEWETTDPRR